MRDESLRLLVKTLYAYQKLRVALAGRLKIKKDGSPQEGPNLPSLTDEDRAWFGHQYKYLTEGEKETEKKIKEKVGDHPIWKDFLKDVKGVGPDIAAVLLSEFDFEKATTVSKMWQFAGLNPGLVRGWSWNDATEEWDITDEMIRGDKKKAGFRSPYNAFLKTKLLGVLGSSFLKCQSSYADIYYNFKNRLEQEEGWKDKKLIHRHRAAMRYMVKEFLKDLYAEGRTSLGLPVRKPYDEDYLGKSPHGK